MTAVVDFSAKTGSKPKAKPKRQTKTSSQGGKKAAGTKVAELRAARQVVSAAMPVATAAFGSMGAAMLEAARRGNMGLLDAFEAQPLAGLAYAMVALVLATSLSHVKEGIEVITGLRGLQAWAFAIVTDTCIVVLELFLHFGGMHWPYQLMAAVIMGAFLILAAYANYVSFNRVR